MININNCQAADDLNSIEEYEEDEDDNPLQGLDLHAKFEYLQVCVHTVYLCICITLSNKTNYTIIYIYEQIERLRRLKASTSNGKEFWATRALDYSKAPLAYGDRLPRLQPLDGEVGVIASVIDPKDASLIKLIGNRQKVLTLMYTYE